MREGVVSFRKRKGKNVVGRVAKDNVSSKVMFGRSQMKLGTHCVNTWENIFLLLANENGFEELQDSSVCKQWEE